MPIPKANSLDLESWSNLLPQERTNDYEFNLLLHKFKSFFNEVREYQRLHSNCSIPRKVQNLDKASEQCFNDQVISGGLTSTSVTGGSSSNGDSVIGSPGQNVINLKKRLFQNNPISGSVRDHLLTKQNTVNDFKSKNLEQQSSYRRQQSDEVVVPHYVSSQNLTTSLSSNSNLRSINIISNSNLPGMRQSGIISKPRFSMSKSSERLDSINNNTRKVTSSFEEQNLDPLNGLNTSEQTQDYFQNDNNIYDAVSPDDLAASERKFVASSGAISLQQAQRSRPELFKSLSVTNSNRNGLKSSQTLSFMQQASLPPKESLIDNECSNNNSHDSSNPHEISNNTSSSLSLNPSYNNQDFGNYVNIDFFLKRSHSPSFDGPDANSSEQDSDEDTAQLSQSISSEALTNLTPREFAEKLKGQHDSSTSITPASSGDFLNDNPQASNTRAQPILLSSSNTERPIESNKFSSFSPIAKPDYSRDHVKSSTTPRESSANKTHHQLEMIQEDHNTTAISARQAPSSGSSHLQSDASAMTEAQNTMRSFLSDLNLSPVDDVFEDKAQRRIVKESFAVELCGRRKLRHLFLFNDVIVCAKYQASSKQKFTFDVRWHLNLIGVSVSDSIEPTGGTDKASRDSIDNEILAIRTNLMLLRSRMQQIKRNKDKNPSKIIKKLKKKRTQLEADLVLLLPHLPLVIKHTNGKKYTFFLSSNFDRNQWIESIKFLQSQLPATKPSSSTPSSSELQAWIQTCRKNLNPSLGTFLLRSNCDDDLLYGDLYISLNSLKGIPKSGNFYFCFEVDSYGHFSQKATSPILKIESPDQCLTDEYVFALDGSHTLRLLLYEDIGQHSKPSVVGKSLIELSRAWFFDKAVEKTIEFSSTCKLITRLSFADSELLSMRVPHAKLCPTFGLDITQVCKKEKTNVPLLIQLCVNEVERRGMREVGIYRMSGTSTDIQRLKKAFETDPYVAEVLLRDIDINSVTGFLKQYLREMPEGLFINKLYPKFVAAFNVPQTESLERTKRLLELLHRVPMANQHTIVYLVEHLVKVNEYENFNKMSLANLATVFGPNILKPAPDSSAPTNSDPFTAVVIGSISQTYILYFYLNRKASNLPLLELDASEYPTESMHT